MAVNRRFLNWGVFLLVAGGVVLVGTSGAVDDTAIAEAWRYWPLVLIGLGIGILLRRTRFGLAGGMLAAAMPGLLLGGMVVAAPRFDFACGNDTPGTFSTQRGLFDGAARVDLTIDCGGLSVTTVSGNGWQLDAGNTRGSLPAIDTSPYGLTVDSHGPSGWFGFTRGRDDLRLALPTANAIDLVAEVNAGRGRFDLAGARLGDARLAVNAGDARVDLSAATAASVSMSVNAASAAVLLPSTDDVMGTFSVNAGSLKICAVSDIGLRIHSSAVLGSENYAGLVRNRDAWESPNYSTALHRADLTVSVNVGSVVMNPIGGCK